MKTLIFVSRRSFYLIALQLLWLSGFAHGGAAEQLASHLQNVSSLKAGFVQVVRDDRGEVLEESKGEMTFKRPDKLRWEVAEPYRYQIITDGETLWRYDPDFEELVTEPFEQVSQTPIMILAASAEQLFFSPDLGEESRRAALQSFKSLFAPGNIVSLALESTTNGE